jgi:hypothetical protein
LQDPAEQVVAAALAEAEVQGGLRGGPPAGQHLQEDLEPGPGLGRAVQPLEQPRGVEFASACWWD